jgi:hypothetical protein
VSSFTISRLDAARRQLRAAIELWFADADPVAVHTLACAAYRILDDANRRNHGPDLLFEGALIKAEYRSEFLALLINEAAFFKYADRRRASAGESVDLDPRATVIFICMSVYAVVCLGGTANEAEASFMSWQGLHDSSWLATDWRSRFMDCVPPERVDEIGRARKSDFYKTFGDFWRRAGRGNQSSMPDVQPKRRHASLPAFEDVVRRMLATPLAREARKKRS